MRLELFAGEGGGEFAAEGFGEGFAGADRVGQQRAAAFEVFAKALAFGVGEVELLAAVHEDHVVLEQVGVADVDQLGGGADLEFQFALGGGAEQVEQCAGGVVAAAAVAEFGDFDDGAGRSGPLKRPRRAGVSKACSLPLGSRLVA